MGRYGSGSITQHGAGKNKPRGKCREWQLRLSVGKDSQGKYRQRTRVVHGSYVEAARALESFRSELMGESPSCGRESCEGVESPSFDECSREWLELRERYQEVGAMSIETYRARLGYVSACLGNECICNITEERAQQLVEAALAGHTASGRPASPNYIRIQVVAAKTLWDKHCIPKGYASSNPWKKIVLPKAVEREPKFLDEEDFIRLSHYCLQHLDNYHLAVLTALCAGLRLGEVCNMQWKDFDGASLYVQGTKNRASKARVPLSANLIQGLERWKEMQAREFKSLGLEQEAETYIVNGRMRGRIPNDSLTIWWGKNRKRIDLEGGFEGRLRDIRFHDLRHSFVSHCVHVNLPPKVTQRLARHATFAVTMDLYAHISKSDMEEAVKLL